MDSAPIVINYKYIFNSSVYLVSTSFIIWLYNFSCSTSRVCCATPCVWVGSVSCFGWCNAHFHALSWTSVNVICAVLGESAQGWEIMEENWVIQPTPETEPLVKHN